MQINMSELYFLPALHGDAFFLHCQKGDEEGWIVLERIRVRDRVKYNPDNVYGTSNEVSLAPQVLNI